MIKKLIENYIEALDKVTNDTKFLIYGKIVLMQLILITGNQDSETRKILDYVREAEREDRIDLTKFYKDFMFLENILERDSNIACNYNMTLEISDAIEERLSRLIEVLNEQDIKENLTPTKLSLKEIRRRNKQREVDKYIIDEDIIESVNIQDIEVVNEEIKSGEPISEDVIDEVVSKVTTEELETESIDRLRGLLENVLDSKVKDFSDSIDKSIEKSLEDFYSEVKTVNDSFKESTENATMQLNNSIDGAKKVINDMIDKSYSSIDNKLLEFSKSTNEAISKVQTIKLEIESNKETADNTKDDSEISIGIEKENSLAEDLDDDSIFEGTSVPVEDSYEDSNKSDDIFQDGNIMSDFNGSEMEDIFTNNDYEESMDNIFNNQPIAEPLD